MPGPLRVLSLYEGFFAGGARILHTDVVAGLHRSGHQTHRVLSIASAARRDSSVQRLYRDPRYLRLTRAGVGVTTLGRITGADALNPAFTERELRIAATEVRKADVILSLKEQPLALLLALHERGLMPDVPVAACLHRSDPLHSGAALTWLTEASQTGLLTTSISCAESTSAAYAPYLSPATRQRVVTNGIDTERFRPGTDDERAETRRMLGIPHSAPVVVFAARFDTMKNPRLFLEAVRKHSALRPGTHYVLCGAGMTWENELFRGLVEEVGLGGPGLGGSRLDGSPSGGQRLGGSPSGGSGIREFRTGGPGLGASTGLHALGIRDDMPAIYQVADIVALTSAFGEASPLCLLEGAACGATPVTTDVGDAARSVEGIGVVTPHDPAAIASAWESVLDRRAELQPLALAARPRMGRERMIDEYRDVIGSMIDEDDVAA